MRLEIKQGQIWEVITTDFLTSGTYNSFKRPIALLCGEMIEIRHPYAWVFRTEDNHYFHAKPEMILKNCRLHGVILDQVHFRNKARLKQILDLQLYDPTEGFRGAITQGSPHQEVNNA